MSEAANTSLSRETLGGTIAQFVMAAIGFVGTIIFARWLGPSAFGGVYLLFALVKFADRCGQAHTFGAGARGENKTDPIRQD